MASGSNTSLGSFLTQETKSTTYPYTDDSVSKSGYSADIQSTYKPKSTYYDAESTTDLSSTFGFGESRKNSHVSLSQSHNTLKSGGGGTITTATRAETRAEAESAISAKSSEGSRFLDMSSAEKEYLEQDVCKINDWNERNRKSATSNTTNAFEAESRGKFSPSVADNQVNSDNYLVDLIKRNVSTKHLSDQEIRDAINGSRRKINLNSIEVRDSDMPTCYYWSQEQVACWIGEIGYPHLKTMFIENFINGRKLASIDTCALNKMGMIYFDEMKAVSSKIRELLGFKSPSLMKSLLRSTPLELYMKKKVFTGRTYDLMTFKSFCEANGFPYEFEFDSSGYCNKCSEIPCTCVVGNNVPCSGSADNTHEKYNQNQMNQNQQQSSVPSPGPSFKGESILPKEELVRNKVVQQIIEKILEMNFKSTSPEGLHEPAVIQELKGLLDKGFSELGIVESERGSVEKLEFSSNVADSLIQEVLRTVQILNDINKVEKYISEKISPERIEEIRELCGRFVEDICYIAAAVAMGDLDLEVIFRNNLHIKRFINGIVNEAEKLTSTLIPESLEFVNSLVSEAELNILSKKFSMYSRNCLKSAKNIAYNLLDSVIDEAFEILGIIKEEPESLFKTDLKKDSTPECRLYLKKNKIKGRK